MQILFVVYCTYFLCRRRMSPLKKGKGKERKEDSSAWKRVLLPVALSLFVASFFSTHQILFSLPICRCSMLYCLLMLMLLRICFQFVFPSLSLFYAWGILKRFQKLSVVHRWHCSLEKFVTDGNSLSRSACCCTVSFLYLPRRCY